MEFMSSSYLKIYMSELNNSFSDKNIEQSLNICNSLISLSYKFPNLNLNKIYLISAKCYRHLDYLEKSLEIINLRLTTNLDFELLLEKGEILSEMNLLQDALNCFNKCIEMVNDKVTGINKELFALALSNKAKILHFLRNTGGAIELLIKAKELDSDCGMIYYCFALIEHQKNNKKDCLDFLDKALAIQPKNKQFLYYAAIVLSEQGIDYKEYLSRTQL